MDSAEFQRVMFRVISIGLFVIGVGTVALVYAFRALGEKSEQRGIATLIGAIAFIAMICAILFRWSFVTR